MDWLITKKVKLKDVKPELAKSVAARFGKSEDELEFVTKGLEPSDLKFDEGEKSAIDYITTKSVDRDGEIVEPTGGVLEHYRKHAVVLFSHDYKELPIGRCAWIKCDSKGLIAKTIYANHEEAQKIYNYRKDGFPLAKSIGFVPLEVEELDPKKNHGAYRCYKQWLLLEYSDVAVPSNPDALQIAISKGLFSLLPGQTIHMDQPNIEIINSKEDTANVIKNSETLEEKTVEKTIDGQGNVSVFTLFECINHTMKMKDCMEEMHSMMNPDKMTSDDDYWDWSYIEDLFPHDYPNGSVIIACIHKGCKELFQYDYSFDEGVVTLINPKMVESTYVAKPEMKEKIVKDWFPEAVLKPEVGDEFIHMPVMDEEGKHSGEGHKVRTISLSKKDSIKAKYCVTDRKVFSVMFPKDKFTMAQAKKWMKDHDMMKSIFSDLIDNLIELEDLNVTKEITKEVEPEVEKAGRALSSKNRKLIQECVDSMGNTSGMLQDLLDSNDKDDEKSIEGKVDNGKTEEKTVEANRQQSSEKGETKEIEEEVIELDDEDVIEFDEENLKETLTNAIKEASKSTQDSFTLIAENAIKKLKGKVY